MLFVFSAVVKTALRCVFWAFMFKFCRSLEDFSLYSDELTLSV